MGMSVSGFHFGMGSIEKEISQRKRDDDPLDYWIDIRGFYRASILAVDYSGAFSGLLLFATSRLRPGAKSMNALYLLPMMLPVPMLLTILRSGCEGHVAEQQPAYTIYASTDETISFDLLPVCFATSKVGPLWAAVYYAAQFLYTSMGPMVVYVSFIYESFVDDIPTVQNFAPFFFALIVTFFAVPSVLLYMPLGTKITALFHYTSESSIIHILCYIIIYFVYGWQTVESDILVTSNESNSISLIQYLTRPTSPVYTAKFTSVFDLLMRGNDVLQHIDAGTLFIPGPIWIRRSIGYGIMFAPTFIVIGFASYTMYAMMVRHRLPFRDLLKPTSDWMVHTAVNTTRPRPHSLAYGLYNSLCNVSYETAFFGLFVIEIFFGIAIFCVFSLNSLSVIGFSASHTANDYRTLILFVFILLHGFALIEMRKCQMKEQQPNGLMLYIGVATMETAMLNGYMWMYASDHTWGLDAAPLVIIVCSTLIRGCCILLAIAIRAHLLDQIRPTRTRDATEIYEVDTVMAMDADDDSPIIFDLARA
uniref:Transmembrane protein n=1 Tax=Angiostrongylus cantonensis TaxID=6313 RepID=A0A158PCL2_ANGCA